MPTRIDTPEIFLKRFRKLARKYPALLKELENLTTQLKNDERLGDKIADVGYDVYKVRLKNPSAQKGKSGGFRVIYYLRVQDHIILLTIYSKSDQSDISPQAIKEILESIDIEEDDNTE